MISFTSRQQWVSFLVHDIKPAKGRSWLYPVTGRLQGARHDIVAAMEDLSMGSLTEFPSTTWSSASSVLCLWLAVQSLAFITAGASVTALLVFHNLKDTSFRVFVVLVVVTNISGALAALSTLAGTILVEREWVVVICSGHPAAALTKINSVIRRIDLSCKLLAPVLSGLVISFISTQASAAALALWNVVSVGLVYWLLVSVYHGVPALGENVRQRRQLSPPKPAASEVVAPPPKLKPNEEVQKQHVSNLSCWGSWAVYMRQEVMLPGVALAILYCTVLSFGTLMTAAVAWRGIPAYAISLAWGFSATVGIAATLLYPTVHSWLSTLRTGLCSIWMQWCCLLLCVGSVWVGGALPSAWLLMAGVAASRLGLWMFDLAVTQLMQDNVQDPDRCVVGGVQSSLQSAFDLLAYVMGIIISDPRDFSMLILMSFFVVTCATSTVYGSTRLFHLDGGVSWVVFPMY